MDRFDRLTTLSDRFRLSVQPSSVPEATLIVMAGADGSPERVCFRSGDVGLQVPADQVLFAARVEWSGLSNPLLAALPAVIAIDLSRDPDNRDLVMLMCREVLGQRCGAESVLGRLGEVLIVRMLRAQIEAGSTTPGLLAGLSDPRISRAIVAIHDRPGQDWRNEELAQVAGLSLSRFAEMFLGLVGETPAAYLRRWRLTLARQDVSKGDRIDAVARRYGYTSPEGFTRAFKRHFGEKPIALRARLAEI